MRQVALVLGGLSLLGAAGFYLSGRTPTSPGFSLGPSPVFSPVELANLSPQDKARYAANVAIMREAGTLELGRDPNDAELQYASSIADLETNFGKGWKGAMVGSNNWGAVQCAANAQQASGCIPYTDSFSTGERYDIAFRSYPSPVEGARDVWRHVIKKRPRTATALAGEGTIYDASLAMRRESYYGGFCPKATSRYSASAIKAKDNRNPQTDAAKACEAEAVEMHAKRVQGLVAKIASAAGLKPMSMGTYADALEKWDRGTVVSGPVVARGDVWDVLSILDEPTRLRSELPW